MIELETNNKSGLMCINNEVDLSMTAEEMFKELGYKKYLRGNCFMYSNFKKEIDIEFVFDEKSIYILPNCSYTTSGFILECRELKAINKQIEELGWK